jgi:AcrR family transcriptional regulator
VPAGGTGESSPPAAGVAAPRRPGRPPNSEGAETRRQILKVATRAFLRSGYDGTSMQAIAEEAGLTRTALYNYFRSRADLARAVLFEHAAESARMGVGHRWWVNSPRAGLSARERLRGLLRASLDDALATLEMGDFYLSLVRESARDPQLRAVLRDYVGGLSAAVRRIFDDALATGELPPGTDTDALLEAVLGMAWALSVGISTAPNDRVRQQVLGALDLVLDAAPWRTGQEAP